MRWGWSPMGRLLALLGVTCVLTLAAQQAHAAPFDPVSIDVFSLAVQADGKVIVSGHASSSTYWGAVFMRINPDGSRDVSFQRRGLGIDGYVSTMAVQPDGKVLLGGRFEEGGKPASGLIRLNADGSRDDGFKPDLAAISGTVETLALAPDASIWVGGSARTYRDEKASGLVRLNPDGSLAQDRGIGAYVSDVVNAADGALLVSGNFRQLLVRLLPDGTRDPDFILTPAVDSIESVALMSDGRVLIGGSLSHLGGPWGFVMRLDAHGRPDISFQPVLLSNGLGPDALTVQSDGSVLSGYYGRLLRLGSDGQFHRLTASVGSSVTQMAVTPEGVIVASDSWRGKNRNLPGLQRIRPDGSADTQYSREGTALRPVVSPAAPLGLRIVPKANRWVISWRPSPTAMGYSVRLGRGKTRKMTDGTVLEVPRRAKTRICVRAVNTAGNSAWVCRRGATP